MPEKAADKPITADRLAALLLNVVYPSRCPVCLGESDSFTLSPICGPCWAGIAPYTGPRCRLCGEPFDSPDAELCGACTAKEPRLSGTYCYGLYDGALKEAIHQFKFKGQRRLAGPLAALMEGTDLPMADFIVPVPSSPGGLRERGYSHTLLLARALSKLTATPLRMGLLVKTKETPPQVGLTRAERLINLRGAFSVKKPLSGERVLLVDDVVTTGTTVRECAKALKKSGAGDVYATALAHTVML